MTLEMFSVLGFLETSLMKYLSPTGPCLTVTSNEQSGSGRKIVDFTHLYHSYLEDTDFCTSYVQLKQPFGWPSWIGGEWHMHCLDHSRSRQCSLTTLTISILWWLASDIRKQFEIVIMIMIIWWYWWRILPLLASARSGSAKMRRRRKASRAILSITQEANLGWTIWCCGSCFIRWYVSWKQERPKNPITPLVFRGGHSCCKLVCAPTS